LTVRRTGEATTARRVSSQLCSSSSGLRACPAASESRTACSAGRRIDGSGARLAVCRASMTLPSSSARPMRPSHDSRIAVTFVSKDLRSEPCNSRPSSSRLTVLDAATTARSSRSGQSRSAERAVTARSIHAARFILGSSSSAIERSRSGLTSALPSERARVFCSSMARRSAGMPPRSSCSATGSCSGRNFASAALRCSVEAWSARDRPGRSPRSGRCPRSGPDRPRPSRTVACWRSCRSEACWRECRSAASAAWRLVPARSALSGTDSARVLRSVRRVPSRSPARLFVSSSREGLLPRGGRSALGALSVRSASRRAVGRSRSPKRPLERLESPREANDTDTVLVCEPELRVPRTSMRSEERSLRSLDLAPITEVTKIPSSSNSASARNTSPGEASCGTICPATTPRGWRAPGARQVQSPSGRLEVSSMSILRAMPEDNATNECSRFFPRVRRGA